MSVRILNTWNPDDTHFWESTGKKIANRNLLISIPCLMLAFSIWMIWSIIAINLDKAGFNFSKNQLFWLTALPALSGATLRIFYSFLVPIFGGRRFTTISTASLLIPALGMGFALRDPNTPYWILLVLSILCGFGGGNFSSSMANINFFYPQHRKGFATGMNAGIGNLGVSLVQFVTPLVITVGAFSLFGGSVPTSTNQAPSIYLQNAGFIWIPFIVIASLLAWFGMNDLSSAKSSFKDQSIIFKRKHNWIMCWLYVGTFGSFIGFSAAFGMLSKTQFPNVDPSKFAYLGPLVGSITRPIGGYISDRMGGAKVTLYTFILMALFTALLFLATPSNNEAGNFSLFLSIFIILFALTGIGNGSTFRMIPVIFQHFHCMKNDTPENTQQATKESAAVLGFTGAIGAYGGFFIPIGFNTSLQLYNSASLALGVFIVFYLSCVAITWWYYARPNAVSPC